MEEKEIVLLNIFPVENPVSKSPSQLQEPVWTGAVPLGSA